MCSSVLLVALIGPSPVIQFAKKKQPQTAEQQYRIGNHKSSRASSRVNDPTIPIKESRTFQEAQYRWDDPIWPDWALVIVGAGAAVVGLGSLFQIKRQVGLSLRFERPWTVVWIDYTSFSGAVEMGLLEIPIVVVCKNFGRTPAWIESTGIRTWTGSEGEFRPAWDTNWVEQSTAVLAPGNPDSFMQQVSTISYRDYMEMKAGARTGFVYGIVIYKDAADATHITRFCYRYKFVGIIGGKSIEGFYTGGPSGYNKYT